MARVAAIGRQFVNRASVESAPIAVADAENHLICRLRRPAQTETPWPTVPGCVDLRVFVSMDAGVTWLPWGGCKTEGDINSPDGHIYSWRDGSFLPETTFRVRVPEGAERTGPLLVRTRVTTLRRCEVAVDVETVSRPLRDRSAHRSVAFVQALDAGAEGASSVSTAAFTPSGSDRYLACGAHWSSSMPATFTSLQFGTTDLALKDGTTSYFNFGRARTSTLVNPAASSDDITLTVNSSQFYIQVAVAQFSGVDQSTPHDTSQVDDQNGSNPTVSVSSASGDMVVDFLMTADEDATEDGDGTNRTSELTNTVMLLCSTAAGAASVSMSYTMTGDEYILYGWNINQAAAGQSASGSPSTPVPTASGVASVGKSASGAPSIPLVSASGAALLERLASGAPVMPATIAAGAALRELIGSGSPVGPLPTAAGEATVGGAIEASGDPVAPLPSAAGAANVEKVASGTPGVPLPTAAGAAVREVTGAGAPAGPLPTASGQAQRELTAQGAPQVAAVTGAGAGAVTRVASGAPTAPLPTAAGEAAAGDEVSASGSPVMPTPTAAGTAARSVTSSGAPAAPLPTAAGAAVRSVSASGSPTIALLQAAGAATRRVFASGAASIAAVIATGAAFVSQQLKGRFLYTRGAPGAAQRREAGQAHRVKGPRSHRRE